MQTLLGTMGGSNCLVWIKSYIERFTRDIRRFDINDVYRMICLTRSTYIGTFGCSETLKVFYDTYL